MPELNEPDTLWAAVDGAGKIEMAWTSDSVWMSIHRTRSDAAADFGEGVHVVPVRVISEDEYRDLRAEAGMPINECVRCGGKSGPGLASDYLCKACRDKIYD